MFFFFLFLVDKIIIRHVDESRTIYASPTRNPLGDALSDAAPPINPSEFCIFLCQFRLVYSLSLLSLLCKNNTFFSLSHSHFHPTVIILSLSLSLCVFFVFLFLVGNGRSDDSRRCVFESQIGAVHDPLQPSSPHRFPLLRSRPVSQALHHLVQRKEMGFSKDAWVRWNAFVTFSNCNISCSCYWLARRNGRTSICCCGGLGMRCNVRCYWS